MRSVIFLLFALGLLIWNGCRDREDDFITDGSVELRFSLDTLRFDTVFTELGSATRYFKVYNPNSRPLRLDIGRRRRLLFFGRSRRQLVGERERRARDQGKDEQATR